MSPRITVSVTATGEFEIWLNAEGRDVLVKELQSLNETSDHFHLGPDGLFEVEISQRAYRPDDRVFYSGKVLFRTDEGDAQRFPHVLETGR